MTILGITTVILLPILLFENLFTLYHLILIGISIVLQFTFRITSYWSATRYNYIRVIFFFILEMPIRPILDMSFYLSGTLAYVFGKNKHNWNKVKRLGNFEVTHQKSA